MQLAVRNSDLFYIAKLNGNSFNDSSFCNFSADLIIIIIIMCAFITPHMSCKCG